MIAALLDNVNEQAYKYVQSIECVTAEMLDLDPRAGIYIYIGEDVIAVDNTNAGKLNYYGGFEYVDPAFVSVIGQYTFYRAERGRWPCRVEECFDAYYAH